MPSGPAARRVGYLKFGMLIDKELRSSAEVPAPAEEIEHALKMHTCWSMVMVVLVYTM